MRLDTGRISIEVPDVFEDVTSYVFEEAPVAPGKGAPEDRLALSFEPMPEHVTAVEFISSLRRTMERLAAGGATFTEESGAAGRIPAAILRALLPGSPQQMCLAAFRWPGGLVAKLQYETTREDAAATFAQITASVRPIGIRRTPPPGYVRRRAGRLWLEVPVALAPLSSYAFSADDGRARLFLENEAGPPGEAPKFDEWISRDLGDSIEVESLNEGSLAADRRPIEERSWRADRISEEGDPLGSTWFFAAWLSFPEGPPARVWMSEDGTPEIGDTRWPEIVAELRPSTGSP
jgi:hypothetical protein